MKMTNTCYSIFQHLIKSLCLQEFPCGIGSWRSPNDKYAENFSSVTTTDYGVGYEKMETLMEYLKSGTWDVDTSWSAEARSLQNMAVVEPQRLEGKKGEKFVHEYFKSLRMVDKEIDIIDPDLLRLCNLENLTLSVNRITDAPSQNLPKQLKVLELCMNGLESVVSLCKKPPPLEHLGLSHNRLYNPEEYKYFTGKYWLHLLSLDLSHNNLEHLVTLVDQLVTLPQLRSLVLQGNPLSLIPGYRGYTLDVLRKLMIFDDVSVSADERHRFKGLARRKENIHNEALLNVSFDMLGGVPMPEELKDLEGRPEFPVVTSQYVVRYFMLGYVNSTQTESPHFNDEPASDLQITVESNSPHSENRAHDSQHPEENTINSPRVEKSAHFSPHSEKHVDDSEHPEKLPSELLNTDEIREVEFNSDSLTWGKWIEMNYKFDHVITNLRALRDFFRGGLKLEVYHKKILSWPLEREPTPEVSKSKSPKGSASKSKDVKKGKSAKDKGKKKTAEAAQELRSDPPVFEKLGSCELPLSLLLEGGNVIDEVLHCGGGPMIPLEELRKMQEADKLQAEEALKVESKKKSRTASRAASSSSKGKDKKVEVKEESAEHEPPPPQPITLTMKVELRKWHTAVDSLNP